MTTCGNTFLRAYFLQSFASGKHLLQKVTFSIVLGIGLIATPAKAAELVAITNFGNNPSNLGMHLYVPDALPNNAPLLVAVHYCTGSGQAFYSGTQYANLANQHKFIVIYPTATRTEKCFDVSTPQAMVRGGNSDPTGIISMVKYVEENYNIDSSRIFVTGVSSGAMMTNVLLALYPDVFAAGASFAGVPYSCFATNSSSLWNSNCANGSVTKTAEAWGDLVRAANPGYGGNLPRVQLWHGTADEVLNYNNFNEAIKQWTNVHSVSQTPSYTDTPQTGHTRTRYGSNGDYAQVEAISLLNVPHNLPVNAAEVIRFFALNVPASSSSSSQASLSSSSSSVSSVSVSSSSSSVSNSVASSAQSSSRSSVANSGKSSGGSVYWLSILTLILVALGQNRERQS